MRFIFIVLFLISFGSVSMGGVGDVYFCDHKIHTTHMFEADEMLQDRKVNVKFKINEKSIKLKIGDTQYPQLNINKKNKSGLVASYIREDVVFVMIFKDPILKFTTTGFMLSKFLFAECDKF